MIVNSAFNNRLVANHLYQAQSNNCGPFCTAMVINLIKGLHIDGNDLAQSMNHPRFNFFLPMIRRIPDYATFPWGITDSLAENGIISSWKFLNAYSDLSNFLPQKKILVILTATYKPLNGHYRILASLEEDRVGFVDPAYPVNEIHYQQRASFLLEWQNAFNPIITVQVPD